MDTSTIEQTATATQGGVAMSIGHIEQLEGGLHVNKISNYRVVGESHFYELNPDKLASEGADDPPRAEELAELLAEHRLLILAGELEDKSECARHIASRLYRRLAERGQTVVVRERCRGKDPQRIETAFHEEHTTILLLTEISQSLVAGYGPAKLRRLLIEKDGYAIVTTDCTRSQWEIAEGTVEARLWQELSWETYYGRDRLAQYLERLFFGSPDAIPEGLLSEEAEGELRVGGVPLPRAVETLKSPERIRAFSRSLIEGRTPPTPEGVEAKLAELAGDAAAIRQWYLQFNDRDQLLVVGLVLLDGLPDDLLFAGLEILVETIWRDSDPLFSQFDYRDLSRFAAYFKQTPIDGGFLRIECGSRKRRVDILQVAWNHQRRRLLATLPALTEMVRVSASEPAARGPVAEKPGKGKSGEAEAASPARAAAERALSRTKSSAMQLQQVVVESLSLIGLMSVEVVEPYLLDLATEPLESVQLLVARALAAWREADKEKEFFFLLHRWWSEACDVGNPDSRIARATSRDPWAEVRATLALTSGCAAQYDRENHLAPEILELLKVLVDDPHPRVREAVWKHALPRAVAWHLKLLDPFLRERILVSEDFVQSVARGAAEACEMRPSESLPIVEGWWAAARSDPHHGVRRNVLPRESLLATVAETFGYIRSPEDRAWISSGDLVAKLRAILTEEGHPFVRRHALRAVENQTREDVELASQLLPHLLTRTTFEDRPQMTVLAVRSYLHERQQLEGGDRKLEIDGRSYAVWTDGSRPLTGIEVALYGWLFDSSQPVAQQLATACFSAFAATALDREERRLLRERPKNVAAAQGGVRASDSGPEVYRLNAFGHLAIVAATPGREEVRPLLRPLMAEIVVERRRQLAIMAEKVRQTKLLKKRGVSVAELEELSTRKSAAETTERIEVILERWGQVRNRSARALAGYLRRAVLLYNWRWGMVAVLGLILYGSVYLLQRAEEKVGEAWGPAFDVLAERTVPSPDVLVDLVAPLPPGRRGEGLRFPFVIPCSRGVFDPKTKNPILLPGRMASLPKLPFGKMSDLHFQPDADQPYEDWQTEIGWTWNVPKPLLLPELAAPLPPGKPGVLRPQRGRKAALQREGNTPRENAWIWRSNVLLTH